MFLDVLLELFYRFAEGLFLSQPQRCFTAAAESIDPHALTETSGQKSSATPRRSFEHTKNSGV